MVPFGVLGPAWAARTMSPRRARPLLQFTFPSESLRAGGIALSVTRPLRGLGLFRLTFEVFPLAPGGSRLSSGSTSSHGLRSAPGSLAHSGPLRRSSVSARLRTTLNSPRSPTPLRFRAPPASPESGSDLRRGCLPRLCCPLRLSQPPGAFFLPTPRGLVSCRSAHGVPSLQRFSPPNRRGVSPRPCPSWRYRRWAVSPPSTRSPPSGG